MDWNPDDYAKNARFVSALGMPVVDLLAPKPGERILDLGCGDGALTKKLLEFGCQVVGVDSSPEMIAEARALGLDAQVMDAQMLHFGNEFDGVFSNAVLHWMNNPESVITGVCRALKPGGRFVAEFGGYGCVSTIVAAIESALAARGLETISPWYFPRAEEYQRLLEGGGFTVKSISLFPRPTLLPGNVGGWLETFAHPFLAALPGNERKKLIREVVEDLRDSLVDADDNWIADYVRLRFYAVKEKKR